MATALGRGSRTTSLTRNRPPWTKCSTSSMRSPGLVIQLNTISVQIQEINRRIGHLHERLDAIAEAVRDANREFTAASSSSQH